ncbi:MAG TPA: LPS export ABC transporter periplasmic protein LptC [Steroidobacteraceae bacterium]|nr:LPS export ABC transporter periplasmic protein LptC [Steroidobacteraceae bacterium]
MIWRVFIVLALLVVAVASLLTGRRSQDVVSPAAQIEPPQPGYYMKRAHIVETGEDGQPLYRVEAERMQQDPADNTIHMDDLKLVYHTQADLDWTLTAAHGSVPPGSRTLDLVGNVVVVGRPQAGSQSDALIRTSRLSVDTQTHIATTRDRVDIEWGARRLSTIGLTADLKGEQLKLESGVHGRFVR